MPESKSDRQKSKIFPISKENKHHGSTSNKTFCDEDDDEIALRFRFLFWPRTENLKCPLRGKLRNHSRRFPITCHLLNHVRAPLSVETCEEEIGVCDCYKLEIIGIECWPISVATATSGRLKALKACITFQPWTLRVVACRERKIAFPAKSTVCPNSMRKQAHVCWHLQNLLHCYERMNGIRANASTHVCFSIMRRKFVFWEFLTCSQKLLIAFSLRLIGFQEA